MPVPSAQEIRKPLLEVFRGEAPHNFVINELLELIAENLGVRLEEMSSTEKTAFKNNINDAKSYLRKHKLLSHPSKTTYRITRAGSKLLEDDPEIIDDDYFAPKEPEPEIIETPAPEVVAEPEPVPEVIEEAPSEEVMEEISEEPEPVPEIETESEDLEQAPDAAPEKFEEVETESEITPEIEEVEPEIEESDSDIPVDFAEQEFEDAQEEIVEADEEVEIESEEPTEILEDEATEENFDADDDPIDSEEELETMNEEFETTPAPEEIEEDEAEEEAEEDVQEIEEEIQEESEQPEDDEIETLEPESETELETETKLEATSDEISDIEDVISKYNDKLADEVLERLAAFHQDNFCMLVMDLLSKMGYRAFQNARYTNEAEGSDLIHGVILENKPGMNPIYIQARKLSPSRTVGKADMVDFIDALADKGGKGMFVTTGTFSEQAEVAANDERIMLVDGKKLAGLMIANNFCVNVEKIFELKAIDPEGFSDYEN